MFFFSGLRLRIRAFEDWSSSNLPALTEAELVFYSTALHQRREWHAPRIFMSKTYHASRCWSLITVGVYVNYSQRFPTALPCRRLVSHTLDLTYFAITTPFLFRFTPLANPLPLDLFDLYALTFHSQHARTSFCKLIQRLHAYVTCWLACVRRGFLSVVV